MQDGFGSTLQALAWAFLKFNQAIIDMVEPFAAAVKPQIAFYETLGAWGIRALEGTIAYARERGLVVITDAKRGDGGPSAEAYAAAYVGEIELFGTKVRSPIRSDAVTVNAWAGTTCVQPFVDAIKRFGTGAFVLDKSSFAPNSEVEELATQEGIPVWQALGRFVQKWGEGTEGRYGYRNLGVVMGATYPDDATAMRKILPNAWFLVPGYGAQGGGADGAVMGFTIDGFGAIVNSARGVIAAWQKGPFQCDEHDFAAAAANAAKVHKKEE